MAATGGGRGPIKAGTGYIDVHPRLNAGATAKMRQSLLREMKAVGAAAGRELSTSMSRAATGASREAVRASRTAQSQIRREGRDTQTQLTRIEQELTRSYGTHAATRFRSAQRVETQRRRLTEGTTAATRAALRQTQREEESAARQSAQRWQQAERSRIQMIRERAAAERRAERERARQQREQQVRELQMLRQLQRARANDLRTQLDNTRILRRDLQDQLREHQRVLTGVQRTQTRTWDTFQRNWRRSSQNISHLGEQSYEAGNLITTHLLGPLGAVSGMLTTIGVKAADSFKTMELGLRGMKVQQQDINRLMKNMQDYAVATPYSLEEMQNYSTRFARVFSSHDERTKSDRADKQAEGSKSVARKTESIIKAVGDNAAASGILDPNMVSRGLYALTIMGDTDRVNMRNLKQFEAATGMPAEELATMMGYESGKKHKTAFAAMAADMQDPKKSGGVSGVEFIDKIIKHWKGSDREGAAERLTEGTISGRIQALQEKSKLGLAQLFVKPGKDGERSEYTALGKQLMGDGGLLDQFEDIAKAMAPFAGDVLKTFFDVVETFTGWLKEGADWLSAHPVIKDLVLQGVKILAVATPFLLGFGLLSKVVGKLGKTLGLLLGPAKLLVTSASGIAKGARGAARTGRQVGAGVRSAYRGDGYLSGYDSRRDVYRDRTDRRARDRQRVRNAGRENGRIRTAAGYGRYGMQRATGYSGLRDWRQRHGNMRADVRDAESRAREAYSGGRLREGVRHQRRAREVRDEYRQNRRDRRGTATEDSRPTDNQDRQEQSRRAIRQLEEQIRQTDQRTQDLRRQLRQVNQTDLNGIRNEFGGSGGRSLRGSADEASRAIRRIRTEGTTPLNRASTSGLRNQLGQLDHEVDKTRKSVKSLSTAVTQLNKRKLGTLRQQFSSTSKSADKTRREVKEASSAVSKLNQRSLKALRREFTSTAPKVTNVTSRVKTLSERLTTLNRKSLSALRTQLTRVGAAASSAGTKVGTANSGLQGRVKGLNSRKLNTVTAQVNKLKDALSKASSKAHSLDSNIRDVNRSTGLGSGKKKSRKKFAYGGVIPGYAPGVDSVPALLSPGEAVLRPEVAHHLGADQIDAWNAAAAKGQLSKHAKGRAGKGTSRSGWPMSILEELYDVLHVAPGIRAFRGGIGMAGAGDGIGGSAGRNVRRWGAEAGGDSAGRQVNSRFFNAKDFVLNRIPDFLKIAPTGVGNLVGLAAGAIAPTAGQLFWDDVWKGKGNILERGGTFLTDLIKEVPSILKSMITDIFDMGKEILSGIKDAISDPKGFIQDTLGGIKEMFLGMVDQMKETFRLLKDIWDNPSEYAQEVFTHFIERVKELMPNTEGLFKFANGGVVPGYSPDDDRVRALLSPGEAVLRPEAVRRLGYQTITDLNRGAKTGENVQDKASGKSSLIIPSPDAATFDGEVKKIETSLAGASNTIAQHESSSNAAWNSIGSKVKSTADSGIAPALKRVQSTLNGPMTTATRKYQSTNKSAMTAVSSKISSTKNSSLSSFSSMRSSMQTTERAEKGLQSQTKHAFSSIQSYVSNSTKRVGGSFTTMKSGVKSLERSFSTGQKNINKSFSKVPTGVTSSVRKAISFIQKAMINPVNSKLLAPAKISKISNLPTFATGGVVPGYSPGNDTVPAVLSPGEAILRPEVTKALGKETIHALNGAAMKGALTGFASGGIIGDWKKAENSTPGGFTATAEPIIKKSLNSFVSGAKKLAWLGGVMEVGAENAKDGVLGQLALKDAAFGGSANVQAALRWAQTQKGKPYQWGGNGNPSWDCSGFMSAIESVIRGQKPHRRWATGAFHGNSGPSGWVRNLKSPFMIGITNAGVGHTAGTLAGTNVESRGGDGVVVGKRARSYKDSLFTSRWGFKPAISTGKGSGAGRWSETVSAVLKELGLFSSSNLANVLKAITKESGGNPKAQNNWDINARNGNPSKGLLQVIRTTFNAYAGKYKGRGQLDPYANIYAAVRYAHSRYGRGWSARMARPGGYWTGTLSASPGLALVGEQGPELVSFKGGERVRNNRETEELLSAGPRYEIHIHEAKSEDTAQAVLRGMQHAEILYGNRL